MILLVIIFTAFSILGLATMIYATLDNRRDLQSVKARGVNSFSRLTASIGVWDSVAAGLFHAVFLGLGVQTLMAPPPPADRTTISTLFVIIAIQVLILGVQIRNQIARLRIRQRLRAGMMDA